jgi:putative flavoprotein involved in K+ transport
MSSQALDVIVIGAGHAGLSISYHLKKHHLSHFVFEQGQKGNTWRKQRWDSFRLNTANKVNLLPGQENIFPDSEGYCSATEYVSLLEGYCKTFNLPVIENSRVISVERIKNSIGFSVQVKQNDAVRQFFAEQVVVASGGQNVKYIPSFANNVLSGIIQLHASEYKNAALLPPGAVLVVGSAQSGMQIAEDLISNGRKVYISTSMVGRVPRRYRGTDIVDWFNVTGFNHVLTSEITDPKILLTRQPQVSGVGTRGHTLSLQSLAQQGVVILGKIKNTDAANVFLEPDAAANVIFADNFSKKIKVMIDDFIDKFHVKTAAPEEDIADKPDVNASCASGVTTLSLQENNITSIIWTTGFVGDFSYLKLPVFQESGSIKHLNGISDVEGLYFIGVPWLRKRQSGIIPGIREDSEYIADKLLAYRKPAN